MSQGRSRHPGWLRAGVLSLMAVLCLATIGPLPVRAAELVTTTVLDSYPATVLPGQEMTYTAHVSPVPPVQIPVYFEQSFDGNTWTTMGWVNTDASGYVSFTGNSPIGSDLGVRYVRAHVFAVAGFWTESMSDPATQTYVRFTTDISDFWATTPASQPIRPGTPSIRLLASGTNMQGTAHFERLVGTDWVEVGSVFVVTEQGHGSAFVDVPGPGEGHHRYRIRIEESDRVTGGTRELELDVSKVPTNFSFYLLAGQAQAHHPFQIVTNLGAIVGADISPQFSGVITVKNVATDEVIAELDANDAVIDMPAMEAGSFTIQASYAGDANILPGTSDPFEVMVLPDVVDATGVRIDLATFYPYKDGYRDTLGISGVRNEASSVAIRIYSPKGAVVRSVAIASGVGPYAYAWNGRTTSGATLANGKYKIVQTLTDSSGIVKTFTAYSTISSKRLYTYSTYINKTIGQAARRTKSWMAWEFYLPTATVYKSLTLQVNGKSTYVGGIVLGGTDFRRCPSRSTWSLDCVTNWGGSQGSSGWLLKTLSTTYNRSGHYVRGFVNAVGAGVVYKARLKVTYAILK